MEQLILVIDFRSRSHPGSCLLDTLGTVQGSCSKTGSHSSYLGVYLAKNWFVIVSPLPFLRLKRLNPKSQIPNTVPHHTKKAKYRTPSEKYWIPLTVPFYRYAETIPSKSLIVPLIHFEIPLPRTPQENTVKYHVRRVECDSTSLPLHFTVMFQDTPPPLTVVSFSSCSDFS